MDFKFSWKKRLLFIPPVVIGIVILLISPMLTKSPPVKEHKLHNAEYQRFVRLSKKDNVSKTAKDNALKTYLNSLLQVQTLKNNLLINQAEQKELQNQLDMAKHDLSKTTLIAPFDIRITQSSLSLAEYVNRGELLLKADSIGNVDISAQFTMGKMRPLRSFENSDGKHKNSYLTAQVSLQTTDKTMHWKGTVQRSAGIKAKVLLSILTTPTNRLNQEPAHHSCAILL
ncbi:MAG TPA: hypothetical protein EYH12_06030 [Psychromonas hadalis]|nr:hypothetical protein [Psychromonas hadalis]